MYTHTYIPYITIILQMQYRKASNLQDFCIVHDHDLPNMFEVHVIPIYIFVFIVLAFNCHVYKQPNHYQYNSCRCRRSLIRSVRISDLCTQFLLLCLLIINLAHTYVRYESNLNGLELRL